MDPVTGAIATQALGSAFDVFNTMSSNKAASKAADKANDFTMHMMKNRHSWEVDDLRKAGLNPILSTHGAPSMGSSAMAQTHTVPPQASSISNSALTAMRLRQEMKNLKAQERNTEMDTAKKETEKMLTEQATIGKMGENRIISNEAARAYWEEKFYQRHPHLYAAEKIGGYANSAIKAGASAAGPIAAQNVAKQMAKPRPLNTSVKHRQYTGKGKGQDYKEYYGPLNRLP